MIYLTDNQSHDDIYFALFVSGGLGSHLDRHENIGKGLLGMKVFTRIMNDGRFKGIPMILETPCDDNAVYAKEIKLLYQQIEDK